jgi:hypothetical protein
MTLVEFRKSRKWSDDLEDLTCEPGDRGFTYNGGTLYIYEHEGFFWLHIGNAEYSSEDHGPHKLEEMLYEYGRDEGFFE